ncbi:MAG: GNAT family N-acetyltransferase [Gammaproteobacteria bacterium]|nr:GNAT family N-acetyltransferase [Gammaproteobacteria bacterium]
MIKEASSADEIMRCFPVMSELRPHLDESKFTSLVLDMFQEGFRLAYLEKDGAVRCVAGFRITTTLFMGKNLYVDDLVTDDSHRSEGHGKAMLAWLRKLALASDCDYLHLDSGTQRQRAHKFYLAENMMITAFHFAEKLQKKK